MKNLLFTLILTTGLCFNSLAQTYVSAFGQDSTWQTLCSTPTVVDFDVRGYYENYNAGDPISVYVNFGDGTDTTINDVVVQHPWALKSRTHVPHRYKSPGLYSLEYRITMADGNSDSYFKPNEIAIGDSCGNLSGRVYVDNSGDCIFNSGDVPASKQQITLHVSGANEILLSTTTDSLGMYYFNPPAGINYDIRLNSVLGRSFVITCPSAGFYNTTAPASGLDFSMECKSGFDLVTGASSVGMFPGGTFSIFIGGSNNRCLPTSGKLKLYSPNPLVTYQSANDAPTSISGDTLIWDFSNLSLNQGSGYNHWFNNLFKRVRFSVDTLAQIGDTICFELIITPTQGDAFPANNFFSLCAPVRAAYDPNDKQVAPIGKGTGGYIQPNQEMTYMVRFQNTGTAPATNVFIIDSIASDVLDMSSFEIVSASHELTGVHVSDNSVVKFKFDNINLPDSNANEPESHGYVMYSIKQMPNLSPGTRIENTAGIYFDWNEPVITNTTLNTIAFPLGLTEEKKTGNLLIYPNPSNGIYFLEVPTGTEASLVEVYNLQGQVVQSLALQEGINVLDIIDFPSGLYLLKGQLNGETIQQRIVKF